MCAVYELDTRLELDRSGRDVGALVLQSVVTTQLFGNDVLLRLAGPKRSVNGLGSPQQR